MGIYFMMPNINDYQNGNRINGECERNSLYQRQKFLERLQNDFPVLRNISLVEMSGSFIGENYGTVRYNEKKLGNAIYDTRKEGANIRYSLHTEPSLGYPYKIGVEVPQSGKKYYLQGPSDKGMGVKPLLLWEDERWIELFAKDVKYIIERLGEAPEFIEIHPPNRFNCNDMNRFIDGLVYFKDRIGCKNTRLVVENRGSDIFLQYNSFPEKKEKRFFLLASIQDVNDFQQCILARNLQNEIGCVVDIGALITAEKVLYSGRVKPDNEVFLEKIIKHLDLSAVRGIHLYGIGKVKVRLEAHKYAFGCTGSIETVLWEEFFSWIIASKSEMYLLAEVFSVTNLVQSMKNIIEIVERITEEEIVAY